MYTRLQDIEFERPEHRIICENLYRDINEVEYKKTQDEEMLEYLKTAIDEKTAERIISPALGFNNRILMSLKIAFWYYSGKVPSQVVTDENGFDVDIFNP